MSSDSVGAILSLVASLSTLMALLTNFVSMWTFEATLVSYSGLVYFVLAGTTGITAVIMVVAYVVWGRKESSKL